MRFMHITAIFMIVASGCAFAADGAAVSVWMADPAVPVMRDTPVPASKIKGLDIFAAGNEYEPAALVIRPVKNLVNVRVTPRSLTGAGGAKIDAWNVSVRNVGYMQVAVPDAAPGAYPDPLPEFAPFTAQGGVNSPVWLTFYVPPKTRAGVYKGSIDVQADGISKITVPVTLAVWDFELPTVSSLKSAFHWDMDLASFYQGAADINQKRKLLDLYNRDFWRHRVSPSKPYQYYDIKASQDGDRVKLDFSEFDTAISKYFALFNSFMLPSFGPHDNAGLDMAGNYDRLKVEYMRMVIEHLLDKGQVGKGYAFYAAWPTEDMVDNLIYEARLAGMADQRIKTMIVGQPDAGMKSAIAIWAMPLENATANDIAARVKSVDEAWFVVPVGLGRTAVSQRTGPWKAFAYKGKGIYIMESPLWMAGEPNLSAQPKWDYNGSRVLYPPVKTQSIVFVEKGPVPSIGWEMLREGIEDYDYFRILSERSAAAKKKGKDVSKAESALDSVRNLSLMESPSPDAIRKVRRAVAEAIVGIK